MKGRFRTLAVLVVAYAAAGLSEPPLSAETPPELERARETYQASATRIRGAADAERQRVFDGYRQALGEIQERHRQAGRFEAFLAIQREAARLGEEQGIPRPLASTEPEDLRLLQEGAAARVERIEHETLRRKAALNEQYLAFLLRLVETLTRENRIAEAQATHAELGRIRDHLAEVRAGMPDASGPDVAAPAVESPGLRMVAALIEEGDALRRQASGAPWIEDPRRFWMLYPEKYRDAYAAYLALPDGERESRRGQEIRRMLDRRCGGASTWNNIRLGQWYALVRDGAARPESIGWEPLRRRRREWWTYSGEWEDNWSGGKDRWRVPELGHPEQAHGAEARGVSGRPVRDHVREIARSVAQNGEARDAWPEGPETPSNWPDGLVVVETGRYMNQPFFRGYLTVIVPDESGAPALLANLPIHLWRRLHWRGEQRLSVVGGDRADNVGGGDGVCVVFPLRR